MNVLVALLAVLASCALVWHGALLLLTSGSHLVTAAYLTALVLGTLVTLWRRRRKQAVPGTTWTLRGRRAAVAAFTVLVMASGAALLARWAAIRPPQQTEIASWLRENKAELEQMRGMLETDRLGGVLDYGGAYTRDGIHFETADRAGLSSERSAEYERLMRATGCQRVDVWSDGRVSFAFRSWGTANHGWRVSVVWSPNEPSPLLPTIDGFAASRPRGVRAFSRLDGPWYAQVVW